MIPSEYRTRHCRKCQVCIEVYDHHCFWIGNCVGRHNHKHFVGFVIVETLSNLLNYKGLTLIPVMVSNFSLHLHPYIEYLRVALLLFALGFIAFTGYLSLYHLMLVCSGMTTWEHMSRYRITYLKHLPKGLNPFSLGIANNIKRLFCDVNRGNGYK